MKVYVTGADGFIGSHLVERLVNDGHEVTALCLYNAFDHHGHLDDIDIEDELSIARGDITDPWFLMDSIQEAGPEIIVNLAAHNSVPHSFTASHSHVMTNIMGAHNVMRCAHMVGSKVIQMSTSEVYGEAQTEVMELSHPVMPQSPYAASKLAADLMCNAFSGTHGLEVVVVRSFNVFGPRQSARAVIPQIICQALDRGSRAIELGNFNAARDWTYVDDTVSGIISLFGFKTGIAQMASGKSHSVLEVAQMVCDILGIKKPIVETEDRKRPEGAEIQRLTGSYASMQEATGWTPKTKFRDGLVRTIEWYKENGYGDSGYWE